MQLTHLLVQLIITHCFLHLLSDALLRPVHARLFVFVFQPLLVHLVSIEIFLFYFF